MAKIQRAKSYIYKGRDVYKFRINIPAELLENLNWKQGTDVEFKIKNKKLEISKV